MTPSTSTKSSPVCRTIQINGKHHYLWRAVDQESLPREALKCFCLKWGYREKNRQGDDTKMPVKLKMPLLLILFMLLASCGRSNEYEVGVFNNTRHVPVKIKIQYPSPEGMKRIRFSMINTGEFKSNQLTTALNPIPDKAKISWENSLGEVKNEVLDLTFVPEKQDDGAVMFDIDEYGATVSYLDKETFAGEWKKRLIRKGYK